MGATSGAGRFAASFSTRSSAKTESSSRGSRRAGIRNSRRRNPGAPGFNALPPDQRAKEKKPAKHRFPVDFHRGLELFGQHASRLKEPGYRETIARCGIILVEGFNDVLGLDALGIPAVAIMSNKITDEPVEVAHGINQCACS